MQSLFSFVFGFATNSQKNTTSYALSEADLYR